MSTTSLAPTASTESIARARTTSTTVAIALIVVLGALLDWLAALPRTSVTYLPDEYLYSQLARSIGTGHGLSILGVSVGMPAMLEPILISPFWRLSDTTTALHLTQAFHSVTMALGAVPVYALATRLSLPRGRALACSALAALAPGMIYAGYVTADSIGYLLALLAVEATVRVCARPTLGTQAWFLTIVGLATFSRLQYVVLVPAFAIAALATERFRVLPTIRRYILVWAAVGTCALAAIVVSGLSLGRYGAVTGFTVSDGTLLWAGKTTAFIAVAAGAALTPGAIAWSLTRVRRGEDRPRTAFAAMSLSLLALLVVAAAVLSADTGSDRFFERYLLVATPLVALGFMCWIDENRPGRAIAVATAAMVVVAAARFPISGDLVGQGSADSPTFRGIGWAAEHIGLTNASLVTALVATACAGLALAAALTHRLSARVLLLVTGCVFLTTTAVAHAGDALASERARDRVFSGSPTWVEAAKPGKTLLVQTRDSNQYTAMVTIISNPTIVRAEPLGPNLKSSLDGIGNDPISVDPRGFLHESDGRLVSSAVLLATGSTASVFSGDERLAHDRYFTLAIPRESPVRLRALAYGVRADTTVAPEGTLTAYAADPGRCTRLRLRLALPRGLPPTTIEFRDGSGHAIVEHVSGRGAPTTIALTSAPGQSRTLRYQATRVGDLSRPFGAPESGAYSMLFTVALGSISASEIPCR